MLTMYADAHTSITQIVIMAKFTFEADAGYRIVTVITKRCHIH